MPFIRLGMRGEVSETDRRRKRKERRTKKKRREKQEEGKARLLQDSRGWGHMSAIPVCGRLRQEDHKSRAVCAG